MLNIHSFVQDNIFTVQEYRTEEDDVFWLDSNNALRRADPSWYRSTTTHTTIPPPPEDDLNGLATNSSGDDGANHPQRPHDYRTLKHKSIIYSQNTQGLWRRARDSEGNVLCDQPRDTTKLEKLIGKMRQDQIGAWLIQETWEEDNEFDIDIGGYHVFRHNRSPGDIRNTKVLVLWTWTRISWRWIRVVSSCGYVLILRYLPIVRYLR